MVKVDGFLSVYPSIALAWENNLSNLVQVTLQKSIQFPWFSGQKEI